MARHVIKLGSGIVAHEDGTLREQTLAVICAQVAAAQARGDEVVVVSSGSIARGSEILALGGRPTAIEDLQAASAIGQGRLYRVYDDLFEGHGIRAAQVLLTFFDLGHRSHYLNARRTLRRLLDWGVVPVVNENDTTATDEITFGDNDFLAAQVAILVDADDLVLLTSIDGLMTADPRRDPQARLIREVSDFETLDQAATITTSTSVLGSGGMRSKVVAAEMATAAGIPTVICNGLRPAALAAVLGGDAGEGTRFPARNVGHSSFKLWLRYAKPPRGTLTVDDGAARALRDGGTSLLPVGIVAVDGRFQAGDAVEIRAADGLLGKGIVGYDATDLRRVAGLRSSAARELIPRGPEEAVHRDYFVRA